MDYKISVVIPCYNAAATLPRAFASLQAQSIGFGALQVLLADDCSTDGSWALLQGWAAQYPNVTALRTPRNSGFAGAPRNLALGQVAAPYVMFLDNDDAFAPDACAALYREAEATGADLVTGYYREVAEDGRPLNLRAPACRITAARKVYAFPQDYAEIGEVRQIFWCKLYRAARIAQAPLRFAEQSSMEDVLFLAQYLMLARSMIFLDVLVYNFTVRAGSISHSYTERYLAGRAADMMRLYEIYAGAGQPACFDAECRGDAAHYLSLIFTSRQIPDEAARLRLLQAWQPMARLALTRGLVDSDMAALLQLVADGDTAAVLHQCPQFLLVRTAAHLQQQEQELQRVDTAYQELLTAHRALIAAHDALLAERNAAQNKLNRWPLYRLTRWVWHKIKR